MKHKQKLVKVGTRRFYVDEQLRGIINLLNNLLTIETVCSCQAPVGFQDQLLPAYINMGPPRAVMQLGALAIEHFDGLIRLTGDRDNPYIQFEIIPLNGGLETFEAFLKNLDIYESPEGRRLVYRDPDDIRGFQRVMINGKPATPKQLADIERERQKAKRNAWA